ncbi:MAG: serpin family protein [Candidatus Limnocylindria bacterium]
MTAATALEAFASDLYGVLAREPGNVVFSPYSAAVALAMTRAGAVGKTAQQMDLVLHASAADDLHAGFNALDQSLAQRSGEFRMNEGTYKLELSTANQLFGQRGYAFEAAFLDVLASQYGAGMKLVDYKEEAAREQARAATNDWVSERTRDRIPELIREGVLTHLTRLVLTNAIYLNARWVKPFAAGATVSAPFHRLDGSETEAQLMLLDSRINYGRGAGFQAVRLPYLGGLSMIAIVPDAGGFAGFEESLRDGSRLHGVIASLGDAQVKLRMPRFEFRSQAALKPALSELGMPIAFTDDADFSGMSPAGRDLRIADVVHEAFIKVDEEGTEAAAATAVIVEAVSAPLVSAELTIDRPFLFLIRDDATGTLIFMGRVLDPS